MNFVKCRSLPIRHLNTRVLFNLIVGVSLFFVGCSDQVRTLSSQHLAEFQNAGPDRPAVDWDRLVGAQMTRGPYRLVPGDVIELTMPAILQAVTAQLPETTERFVPFLCRVGEDGTIGLPIVGRIQAAGKTLAQIELVVVQAYYPKYAVLLPTVTARVIEYRTSKVAVTGAVQRPGVYELRADQMSLVSLLMQAGGIVDEGAARIRIIRSPEATPPTQRQRADTVKPDSSYGVQEPVEQTIKTTVQEMIRHAAEKSVQQDGIEWSRGQFYYPAPAEIEEIEIRITFRQPETLGLLTVKHDGGLLMVEQMDMASQIQRQAVIEKLAQRETRVSTAKLKQWLWQLAEQLENGSGQPPPTETLAAQPSAKTININDLGRNATSGEPLKELTGRSETIAREKGSETLSIARSREPGKIDPIVLPVKGLNVPFADVELCEGDTVVVEPIETEIFSVVGLVKSPGNFAYPLDARYNLMQAIAFAGGLDLAADPRYATIYRLKADGTIVRAPFEMINTANGSAFTDALAIPVKPGDIVAIEHTPRTRATLFLQQLFSVHIGAYVPVWR